MSMRRTVMRRLLLSVGATALLVSQTTRAQDDRRCFPNVPGITACIEGRFRAYWEANGGLPVFGYPNGPAVMETTVEGTFLTQYFERARFELHPEHARPYDVLLGRLGDTRLGSSAGDWRNLPKGQPQPGCLWFAETQHSVCDQQPGVGFKRYWEQHGLQDPALNRFQRSLALFGLPLTEPQLETNAAGDTVLTQWFERARFEFHPGKPRGFQVLLGLLGTELWPRCSVPLTGGFGRLWTTQGDVRARLGCPLHEEHAGPAAEQVFERGAMYWWSGTETIYALLERAWEAPGSGEWIAAPNTWRAGEALAPLEPPPGLHAPEQGFGKLWRENGYIQTRLGWGRAPEAGMSGVFQPFEHGAMLYSPGVNGHGPLIYVLTDARVHPRSAFYQTFPD